MQFSQLVTYDPDHQRLLMNSSILLEMQSCFFVSVVEVKKTQLSALTSVRMPKGSENGQAGIYVSERIWSKQNGKNVRLLYLPPSMGRIDEKVQDLLASLLIMLTNVCVFDISCKYLRRSSQCPSRPKRHNYLTMHSNSGQLFRVEVQSNTTKLQLSTKVSFVPTQDQFFAQEFTTFLSTSYQQKQIKNIFNSLCGNSLFYKNCTNLQEQRARALISLRIHEELNAHCKEYDQLVNRKQMLTLKQIDKLKEWLRYNCDMKEQFECWKSFNGCNDRIDVAKSAHDSPLIQLLKSMKETMINDLVAKNRSLSLSVIAELKTEHFKEVRSISQMRIKKQVTEKILEQYGIEPALLPVLTAEMEAVLKEQEIGKLRHTIYEKDRHIDELTQMHQSERDEKQQLRRQYDIAIDKICTFKHINMQFMRVTGEYQAQRKKNRQNKIEIESLMINKLSIEKTQSVLEGNLRQLTKEKEQLMLELSNKNKIFHQQEQQIRDLGLKLKQRQGKIKGYLQMESQALGAIEKAQSAQRQMQKLKKLCCEYQSMKQLFKKEEIVKFNYILKRNHKSFMQLKTQKQHHEGTIASLEKQIKKLKAQVQESRVHVKYCQGEIMRMMKKQDELRGHPRRQYGVIEEERGVLEA